MSVDITAAGSLGIVLAPVVVRGAVHVRVAHVLDDALPSIARCVAAGDILVAVDGERLVNVPLSAVRDRLATRPTTLRFASAERVQADADAASSAGSSAVSASATGRVFYVECSACKTAVVLESAPPLAVDGEGGRQWFCAQCLVGKRIRVPKRNQWGTVRAYRPPPIHRHLVELKDGSEALLAVSNADVVLSDVRVAEDDAHARALAALPEEGDTIGSKWLFHSGCEAEAILGHRLRGVSRTVGMDVIGTDRQLFERPILEYLVKFRGVSHLDASWVRASELRTQRSANEMARRYCERLAATSREAAVEDAAALAVVSAASSALASESTASVASASAAGSISSAASVGVPPRDAPALLGSSAVDPSSRTLGVRPRGVGTAAALPSKRARLEPSRDRDPFSTRPPQVECVVGVRAAELDAIAAARSPNLCTVCRLDQATSQLTTCDGCDLPHHAWCLPPKSRALALTRKAWLCPKCTAQLAANEALHLLARTLGSARPAAHAKQSSLRDVAKVAGRDPAPTWLNALANAVAPKVDSTLYLVKWRGRSYSELTWESLGSIDVEKVLEFHLLNRRCAMREDAAAAIVAHMSLTEKAKMSLLLGCRGMAGSAEERLITSACTLAVDAFKSRAWRSTNLHRLTSGEKRVEQWVTERVLLKRSCLLKAAEGSDSGATMVSAVLEQLRTRADASAIDGNGREKPVLLLVKTARREMYVRQLRSCTALVTLVLPLKSKVDRREMHDIQFRCQEMKQTKQGPRSEPATPTRYAFDVAVMSLENFLEDELLRAVPWHLIIIDQAHEYKFNNKESGKLAKQFSAVGIPRILLSDRNTEKSPDTLWRMLNFLCDPRPGGEPPAFGALMAFRRAWVSARRAEDGVELRRIKKFVSHWVATIPLVLMAARRPLSSRGVSSVGPILVDIEMSMVQKRYFRRILVEHKELLRGGRDGLIDEVPRAELESLLLQLQQLCTHPYLLSGVERELQAELVGTAGARIGGALSPAANHAMEQLINVSAKFQLVDKLVLHACTNKNSLALVANCEATLELLQQALEWRGVRAERAALGVIGEPKPTTHYRRRSTGGPGPLVPEDDEPAQARILILHASKLAELSPESIDAIVLLDFEWNDLAGFQEQSRRLTARFSGNELYVLAMRDSMEIPLLMKTDACAFANASKTSADAFERPSPTEILNITMRSSLPFFTVSIADQCERSHRSFRAPVTRVMQRALDEEVIRRNNGKEPSMESSMVCDLITPELTTVETLLWHLEANAVTDNASSVDARLHVVRCVAEMDYARRFALSDYHSLEEALQHLSNVILRVIDHPLFASAPTCTTLRSTIEFIERVLACDVSTSSRTPPLLLGRQLAVRRALQRSVERAVVQTMLQPGYSVADLVPRSASGAGVGAMEIADDGEDADEDDSDEEEEEDDDDNDDDETPTDAAASSASSSSAALPRAFSALQSRQLLAQSVLVGKCLLPNAELLPGLVSTAAPHDAFVLRSAGAAPAPRLNELPKLGIDAMFDDDDDDEDPDSDTAITGRHTNARRAVTRNVKKQTSCECAGTGCVSADCGCVRAGGFCSPLCRCSACINMASEVSLCFLAPRVRALLTTHAASAYSRTHAHTRALSPLLPLFFIQHRHTFTSHPPIPAALLSRLTRPGVLARVCVRRLRVCAPVRMRRLKVARLRGKGSPCPRHLLRKMRGATARRISVRRCTALASSEVWCAHRRAAASTASTPHL